MGAFEIIECPKVDPMMPEVVKTEMAPNPYLPRPLMESMRDFMANDRAFRQQYACEWIPPPKSRHMEAYEAEAQRVTARIRREELLEKVAQRAQDCLSKCLEVSPMVLWENLSLALKDLKADGWEPK